MTDVNGRQITHRQRQARETRARIVAAARRLFQERGYATTTIQAIAEEAGVAIPTVYDAFGSKRGILEAARVAMLAESELPTLMAEAIAEPDPGRKLDLAARWNRQQMERSSDVIRAFREGSRFDEDVAKDHRRILDNRSRNMERFIDSLASALAPGMTPRTATDLFWTYSNEELYRELVVERGWSPTNSSAGWHRPFAISCSGSIPRRDRTEVEGQSPRPAPALRVPRVRGRVRGEAEQAGDEWSTLRHLIPEGPQDGSALSGWQLGERDPLGAAGPLEVPPARRPGVRHPSQSLTRDDVARPAKRHERHRRAAHQAALAARNGQDVLGPDPQAAPQEPHVDATGWTEPSRQALVAHGSLPVISFVGGTV